MSLTTEDGQTLEYLWDTPVEPRGVAVLCHPHPLQGGTMRAPLMEKVTAYLVEAGIAVLRFNFRGVGTSTGAHDLGVAEQWDIAAAVEAAELLHPDLPHGLSGWSFGAATSLVWRTQSGNMWPWVGIAPPVSSDRTPGLPTVATGHMRFILGDRDQFTTPEEMKAYTDAIGAELVILPGSDHFFYFREDRVAEHVLTGLFR